MGSSRACRRSRPMWVGRPSFSWLGALSLSYQYLAPFSMALANPPTRLFARRRSRLLSEAPPFPLPCSPSSSPSQRASTPHLLPPQISAPRPLLRPPSSRSHCPRPHSSTTRKPPLRACAEAMSLAQSRVASRVVRGSKSTRETRRTVRKGARRGKPRRRPSSREPSWA